MKIRLLFVTVYVNANDTVDESLIDNVTWQTKRSKGVFASVDIH